MYATHQKQRGLTEPRYVHWGTVEQVQANQASITRGAQTCYVGRLCSTETGQDQAFHFFSSTSPRSPKIQAIKVHCSTQRVHGAFIAGGRRNYPNPFRETKLWGHSPVRNILEGKGIAASYVYKLHVPDELVPRDYRNEKTFLENDNRLNTLGYETMHSYHPEHRLHLVSTGLKRPHDHPKNFFETVSIHTNHQLIGEAEVKQLFKLA